MGEQGYCGAQYAQRTENLPVSSAYRSGRSKVSREKRSRAACLPENGGRGPRNEAKSDPSLAVATVWSLAPLCDPPTEW